MGIYSVEFQCFCFRPCFCTEQASPVVADTGPHYCAAEGRGLMDFPPLHLLSPLPSGLDAVPAVPVQPPPSSSDGNKNHGWGGGHCATSSEREQTGANCPGPPARTALRSPALHSHSSALLRKKRRVLSGPLLVPLLVWEIFNQLFKHSGFLIHFKSNKKVFSYTDGR